MSWILKRSQNKEAFFHYFFIIIFFLELLNNLKVLLRKMLLCNKDTISVKIAMLSLPSTDKKKVLLHDETQGKAKGNVMFCCKEES